MIDTDKLKEVKKSALIVLDAVETKIINSTVYAEPTIAQAVALVTVCDKVIDIIHDYLIYPEDHDDIGISTELLGMYYLFRSIHEDPLGYDEIVLECVDDSQVDVHFQNMVKGIRSLTY